MGNEQRQEKVSQFNQNPIPDRSLKFDWMDTKEAATFLRISVKALRNATSNGQIPYYKLGRRNRYRKSELESVLLSQKRGKQIWE